MKNKNNLKKFFILVSILAVLLIAFYLATGAISKYTGFSVFDEKYDFRKCLEEKDITLFINSETPLESLKENPLYNYLDSIDIINCKRNNDRCIKKEINGHFPSWVINDKLIKKDISIIELSESSGCKLI